MRGKSVAALFLGLVVLVPSQGAGEKKGLVLEVLVPDRDATVSVNGKTFEGTGTRRRIAELRLEETRRDMKAFFGTYSKLVPRPTLSCSGRGGGSQRHQNPPPLGQTLVPDLSRFRDEPPSGAPAVREAEPAHAGRSSATTTPRAPTRRSCTARSPSSAPTIRGARSLPG